MELTKSPRPDRGGMFLRRFRAHNYKSLRTIDFRPTPFSALIGPNASGKSNFTNAIHFLSEVYSQGLEIAIARKGGFDNIAFRKQRRTKAPIEFYLELEGDRSGLRPLLTRRPASDVKRVRLTHGFLIDTPDRGGIRAEFSVKNEHFAVWVSNSEVGEGSADWTEVIRLKASADRRLIIESEVQNPIASDLEEMVAIYQKGLFGATGEQELFITSLPIRGVVRPFTKAAGEFAVYQLSPLSLRGAGIPTPNPKLSAAGENLPALVDWLKRKHPSLWPSVMAGMREVLPALNDVQVQYLHTRTLGLFFVEDGAGRPWSADEVSDGTVQSLALFVAAADPRTSLLVIEEPENSVHPWIIRALVKRLREVSKKKSVVVTTHSPVLIDLLEPSEAWVLARTEGETTMSRLIELEPNIVSQWEAGQFKLSQFLDSGFIPQAVPGGVE